MATKRVTISSCDRCGKEGDVKVVRVMIDGRPMIVVDLCARHRAAIENALAFGRRAKAGKLK
jgi:ribosome-binding protein aMBF1 (putative translation factor)